MCPGGQRRIHQLPTRVQHREVHRSARAVEVGHQAAQTVRQRLFPSHPRQCRDRHVQRCRGLLNGVGEQRVRRQLGEDAVTVLQRRLHGSGEPHGVAQVVRPVVGVAQGRSRGSNRVAE